jgi:phospholipid/cholesterol/gamma-HCH transport system ATP-binding protein
MTTSPLLELKNVSLMLDGTLIHRSISFPIHEGEVVTILGPSGTGKTVLLKLIIGLLLPTSGDILLRGESLSRFDEVALKRVRTQIGMLFQGAALFDSLSVFENVAYSLREVRELKELEIRERVFEKLALVGLEEYHNRLPSQLSGGQKKRIGLARALASNPRVMLFDEPTTGLDPTSRNMIDNLIIQLRELHKITSIVVTHDMESARRISDRLLLIADGTILVDGRAATLWESNDLIRAFSEGEWK